MTNATIHLPLVESSYAMAYSLVHEHGFSLQLNEDSTIRATRSPYNRFALFIWDRAKIGAYARDKESARLLCLLRLLGDGNGHRLYYLMQEPRFISRTK